MPSKPHHRFADAEVEITKQTKDPRILKSPAPVPVAPVSNPAADNVVYFDHPIAFAYGHGVGSVTLTGMRQLVDASGQVYEDRIITGLLRAPLPALLQLRQVIDEIEKLSMRGVVPAADEPPPGLPN